jgi:hypothetical protein
LHKTCTVKCACAFPRVVEVARMEMAVIGSFLFCCFISVGLSLTHTHTHTHTHTLSLSLFFSFLLFCSLPLPPPSFSFPPFQDQAFLCPVATQFVGATLATPLSSSPPSPTTLSWLLDGHRLVEDRRGSGSGPGLGLRVGVGWGWGWVVGVGAEMWMMVRAEKKVC